MNQESVSSNTLLESIPVNRRLIDELYAHGKITREARVYALDVICPAQSWAYWVSKILLILASVLILAGVVYFFAYNWAKMSPFLKMGSIQLALLVSVFGAYFYSLKRISGQLCLISANVLTGVFMAVFGQIYQTGADAYQLFMMWSLLTLGWAVLSNFAAHWMLWLLVSNIFLALWWDQVKVLGRGSEALGFILLAGVNGLALAGREYVLRTKSWLWLDATWIRSVLGLATIFPLLIPTVNVVIDFNRASHYLVFAAICSVIGHVLFFIYYRYRNKDMWSLSLVVLSSCIFIEAAGLRVLAEMLNDFSFSMFLFSGLMTVAIFTLAVIYLRNTLETIKVKHV